MQDDFRGNFNLRKSISRLPDLPVDSEEFLLDETTILLETSQIDKDT